MLKRNKKKLYILEVRRHINQHLNVVERVIGVFTSPEKCIQWVKENDSTWFDNPKAKRIYAVVSTTANTTEYAFLHCWLDQFGYVISWRQ